ncbi:MAG: cation:proton antiporter [Gammaproteobacteria bacterium]|nr:cation:proton antiporter [Gammaproteobacteria bacterium]
MEHGVLWQVVMLLTTAVVAVAVCKRYRLPSALAYFVVGAFIGPEGFKLIPRTEDVQFLAEFGVVFLLFTVGLEFSLPILMAMKRVVLGLGAAQVVVTTAVVGAIAWLIGLPGESAVVLGGMLAMSSTAIVIRQLTEQLEINSRHGRLAVGILLFQDLAVVPFLILIPALAAGDTSSLASELVLALIKGVVVIVVMMWLGYKLLRPLFRAIAAFHSAELFTLTALLFALAAAWITQASGLSMALGGFLAGMMIGETEFKHQVEADIRPFRDVLMGLFFISIGMLLDLPAIFSNLHWILLLLLVVTLFKIISIMWVTMMDGAPKGVALRTGIVLGQSGEFGLALLMLAFASGLFTENLTHIIAATMVLSMALAPFLLQRNGVMAKIFCAESYSRNRQEILDDIQNASQGLAGHVIICGYGRTGQNIGHLLEQEGFQYVALDLDASRVNEAKEAGEPASYGDSTHHNILQAAGLATARAVVITYDDVPAAEKVLINVRNVRPDIPVLVRTSDDSALERLQNAGATEVVPETLEAALMLGSHLFLLLNLPVTRILRRMQAVRNDRYHLLRAFFPGQDPDSVEGVEPFKERLHSVTLPPKAYAVGKSLGALELETINITVTAVRRGGVRGSNPSPLMQLQPGDTLVLYGTPEDIVRAEGVLISG